MGLQNSARHTQRPDPIVRPETPVDIELRLCRADDDPALERLAALNERPLAFGRFVVALSNGQLAAALPLAGGRVLTDPFVRTAHLLPLLEVRAEQIRGREPRRRFLSRPALRLHRAQI